MRAVMRCRCVDPLGRISLQKAAATLPSILSSRWQHTCSGEPGSGSPDATLSTDSEYAPAVRARKATARHPSAPTLTAVDTGPGPEPDAATMAVDRPSVTRLPNLLHITFAQESCYARTCSVTAKPLPVVTPALGEVHRSSQCDLTVLSHVRLTGRWDTFAETLVRIDSGGARIGHQHVKPAGLPGGPAALQGGGIQPAFGGHGRSRHAGAPLPYGAARRILDCRNELEGAGLHVSMTSH